MLRKILMLGPVLAFALPIIAAAPAMARPLSIPAQPAEWCWGGDDCGDFGDDLRGPCRQRANDTFGKIDDVRIAKFPRDDFGQVLHPAVGVVARDHQLLPAPLTRKLSGGRKDFNTIRLTSLDGHDANRFCLLFLLRGRQRQDKQARHHTSL